ncbi:hypothetical protein CEP51_016861 [Fusarium floridanum]|uniref:Uncharacterized protein n=1 Tax=Fusarium floridanum TaxID=1325733 RepID=A0A428NDT9_9HYPO|nr:hypothetical protein CEP51_016861 [Fusarium floridanum]
MITRQRLLLLKATTMRLWASYAPVRRPFTNMALGPSFDVPSLTAFSLFSLFSFLPLDSSPAGLVYMGIL